MIRWSLHLKGPKRTRHAAVTVGHKVYSFGGYGDGENSIYDMGQIGVHVFNTVSLRWMKLPPVTTGREHPLEVPSRRWGHTAVLIDDIIYIWGGEYCNELYAFDVNTHKWFKPKISGTVPGARWGHSACVLEKVMYILGGFNEQTGCTNDIYKLDTTTMVWSLINTTGTPQALACHSATIIGTRMFVFACQGDQPGPDYNSIRVFDTETNCWVSTPSAQLLPEGRWCHSAFAYNGELYIFGGHNFLLDRFFNDLWKLNPKTFSWKKVEPKGKGPCPLMSRMCCCMMGDRIIIFGGYRFTLQAASVDVEDLNEDDAELSDLYILDFSPSLKTLCKLAVIQCGLVQSGLPHDIRWELEAMTTNGNSKRDEKKKDDNCREQVPGNGTENVRQGDGSLHSEGIESRAQECAHALIPTRN